jgi:5-methylcytosine-specific restriction enzyme A
MAPREPRRSAQERGYTQRWVRASKAFLARYPCCGMRPNFQPPVMSRCHDEDRVTKATLTDHVTPHRGDLVKFWDQENWQAMCRDCHAIKTAREDNGSARPRMRRDA